MPRTTRVIALGLVCLALASSALQAAPSTPPARAVSTPVKSGELLATMWKWIVSIVVPRPELPEHASKATPVEQGSQLDPDGND
jgi:hypothetical protein